MATVPSTPNRNPLGVMILMILSYPLLAHFAVLSDRPALIAASIALLLVLVLWSGLRQRSPAAWTALAAGSFGLYAIAGSPAPRLLLFLPPVLITGFVAWVFGHTLKRGQMPLIERLVRVLDGTQGELTEEIISYARRLTGVWTAFLVILTVINAALALCAEPGGLLLAVGIQPAITVPLSLWSLFANALNYVLIAALFVLEFMFRRRRFPQHPSLGLLDFTRSVVSVGGMFRGVSTASPPDPAPGRASPADDGQAR